MQRIPEPEELMDEAEQAAAYAAADFSEPNTLFVERFPEQFGNSTAQGRALDLGCGPAEVTVQWAAAYPKYQVDAVDGAEAMLAFARKNIAAAGLIGRVRLLKMVLPSQQLAQQRYQAILSNSLLHHLVDPQVLWQTIRTVGIPGAAVLVMDLMRPESPRQAEILVQQYAKDAPAILQRDFYHSLVAAFRLDEVADQLKVAGLHTLTVHEVSDRHLAVSGRLPSCDEKKT